MGQQFSSVAESVGSGAGGLAYSSPPLSGGGIISDSAGVVSHPSSQQQQQAASGEGGADTWGDIHRHHQQQSHWDKGAGSASFDSSRALPPLPKPHMANASSSINLLESSAGTSRPALTGGGGGIGGAGEQKDTGTQGSSSNTAGPTAPAECAGPVSFMPRAEMELGKMSIREAIDSFIEKCLHNSNDGGASDNESSEESLGNHVKVTANNIFAIDNTKRSPSSSSQSPLASKDKDAVFEKNRLKAERENRTSRDSGSSSSLSSSPKSFPDRGDQGRPRSRQKERSDKFGSERRDSNAESKDSKSEEVKHAIIDDGMVKIESGADESEHAVLVIDSVSEDQKSGKVTAKEEHEASVKVEREGSLSPDADRKESKPDVHQAQQVKAEPESQPSKQCKLEGKDSSEASSLSEQKLSADRSGSSGEQRPWGQQQKGNLLKWELSKKPATPSSPSPSSEAKAVRPAPFLPGPIRLQFLIDKVLDSSLNEGAESCLSDKAKTIEEEIIDVDKKPLSPKKESEPRVEVVEVDEPVSKEPSDSKDTGVKSEREKLKDQISQSQSKNIQMCFKDHIEKVLLESFLSYEEEERKEALRKSNSPSTVYNVDGKGSYHTALSKTTSSPKNAISVQDIVDQVINRTGAINKNMSTSAGTDSRASAQGEGRYSTPGGPEKTSTSASASHPHHGASSSSAAAELSRPNQNYHHSQQQQQHTATQPMSSQDKALQEAQRHVVVREHQSSTTTGRKRGRPRRVSPSTSSGNSSTSKSHPHHSSSAAAAAEYRMNSLAAGHHYPEDRSRSGHHPGHGPHPSPLDYNPHGSLSYGLPPGVSTLLPPPGSASFARQHQLEQQRQQLQAKEHPHGHAVHGSPSGAAGYPPPGTRSHHPGSAHPRDAAPHHLDFHHSRSHMPHPQQPPSGGSTGSSSGSGGIKPPPPLILADNISPSAAGTRLVPVSHIPTKSCSCQSCVAHFSGSSSSSSSAREKSGSPAAAQHARLVQQQHQHQMQGLRPGNGSGSSGSRHDSRETSRSPHAQHHAAHPHPVYGAGAGPYRVSSPPPASAPSSAASSRHCLPPSAKDYYSQHHPQHMPPRGGDSLRPVVPFSGRGFPPQAVMPTFVSSQRQQQHLQQRDALGQGQDVAASSSSSHHPQAYSSYHPYYDSKQSTSSLSSTPSSSAYQHTYPSSPHHPHPHHSHHPHPQQQQQQQQHNYHQHQQHSSPSQPSKLPPTDHRYPDHESGRHADHMPPLAAAPLGSEAAHYRYEPRGHREAPTARPLPPPHVSPSSSSPRGPPPGSHPQTSRQPAPVEVDADAPLDLSVKPGKKDPSQQPRTPTEGAHRSSQGPPVSEAELHHSRGSYRRRSQELSEGYSSQYRDAQPGQSPHGLPHQDSGSGRLLPHHRSPYVGPHHPQYSPHPSHHHSHLRASVSPHQSRSDTHPSAPPPHHHDQQERLVPGYPPTSRAQQSPVHQRAYPPHVHPPNSSSGSSNSSSNPRSGYPHYPMAPASPSGPQHPHHQAHHTQPLPPPSHSQQHYISQPQHHRTSISSSSSSSSSTNHGSAAAATATLQSYYSRSPVLGRPRAVSPGSAGTPHYQKLSESSPHQPYSHGSFPPPPQSNSPYQRPPSHSQEGENPRPSPVSWGHVSSGPPPPLARGSSDTPSPDEDELDPQGKLNISKHEPIQNIIGNHSPGDILYLICRLCRQTYGNPYGFRKHFRKEHGFEPKAEHTVVQTISATKSAMAHPPSQDHIDSSRGSSTAGSPDDKYGQHHQSQHRHAESSSHQSPYPLQRSHVKQGDNGSRDRSRSFSADERSERVTPKRSEVMEDLKLLECPECSQTFQLNDFGSYKRHCRQHSGGSGAGPFLCHDCQRCFAEPDQLQEHLNTHADFTPSVCGICLTPFSAPDYLAEHLKAAHGHTGGSSSGQAPGAPAWDKSEAHKPGYLPSVAGEGSSSHKPWGPTASHRSHSSVVPDASSSSASPFLTLPPSKRPLSDHSDPQHAVVHTPRGLQIEKLPADPAVMTASPDSSYSDEKLHADSQPGSTSNLSASAASLAKVAPNSSGKPADLGSHKQADRDSDSNSPFSKSKDGPSSRPLGSPLTRHGRDFSSKSQTSAPGSQPPSSTKLPSESSRSAGKEDSESVSSDRCASVESNSLSVEGSRTSSPAPDEPEFFYKHKKYSRYNRKRSTESSITGEPATKSARSSSAESNTAASGSGITNTNSSSNTATPASASTALASPSSGSLLPGGKNELNLSPVVTSSANATRDCESSTSSSCAISEDSSSARSPSGSNKGGNSSISISNSSSSSSLKKGGGESTAQRDCQGKKAPPYSSEDQMSKDKSGKLSDPSSSHKKRKQEESEEKSPGKPWNNGNGVGSEPSSAESSKFKWERMTRSQVGKSSYTSSS